MMPSSKIPVQFPFANSRGRFLCQVGYSHTPGLFWLGLLCAPYMQAEAQSLAPWKVGT